MREKYVKLLVTLQEQDGYIRGGDLAKVLGVSDRTVRTYIKDLNDNYLVDAKIKNNNNKGYVLIGEIKEVKQSQQIEFAERAFFIVKYLLEHDDWVTYDEIAEDLLFSSQTIRSDVLKIQQLMQEQLRKIKIESVIFQGICLKGSEIDKRLFLDSLSKPPTLTNLNLNKVLAYYFKDWVTTKEVNQIVTAFQAQIQQLNIPANSESMLPIISYLIICLKRIETHHSIENANHLLSQYDITKTQEYAIASQLLTKIVAPRSVTIPEGEIIYFSFYLMSQRLIFDANRKAEFNIPTSLRNQVTAVLNHLETEYKMSFLADTQLYSGLLLHLARDIYPLLFNFYIENAFITTIKQEYIQAYYIAARFAHLVGPKLNLRIPENEIGFIALHFASFIERNNRETVKIAIVTGRNYSTSVLLKKEIERKISDVAVQQIIHYEEIDKIETEVQLLVSPIELPKLEHILTVQVSPFITNEDILKINQMINHILSSKLLTIQSFQRTKLTDKKAILENILADMGEKELLDSVLAREQLSTTEVGNGAAIPHPINPGKNSKITIGVAVLEKPIDWGTEEVNLVFLVVSGQEKQAETGQLMSELHRIISNKNLINQLNQATTKEEFIQCLEY